MRDVESVVNSKPLTVETLSDIESEAPLSLINLLIKNPMQFCHLLGTSTSHTGTVVGVVGEFSFIFRFIITDTLLTFSAYMPL